MKMKLPKTTSTISTSPTSVNGPGTVVISGTVFIMGPYIRALDTSAMLLFLVPCL